MADKGLNIILRVKDNASAPIKNVQSRLTSFKDKFKQNWLAITASITAAIMALKKAWDMAELGAKAEQIETSFASMAKSVNISAEAMKKSLQEASAETTNFSNIAAKASALMAQGLSMQQITALMRQARAEAKIFGSTTEEAFGNMTSAITGGLVTTLRRTYGLQLSLKDAVDDYAKSTGKATEEVTKNYLALALADHVLDKSTAHLKAANLEVMTNYEKIQKLKAEWLSFKEELGQALLKIFQFMQSFMAVISSGFSKLLENITAVIKSLVWLLVKIEEGSNKITGLFGKDAAHGMKDLYNSIELNRKAFELMSEESAEKAYNDFALLIAKTEESGEAVGDALKGAYDVMKDETVEATAVIEKETDKTFNYMEALSTQAASNIQNSFSNYFFKAFTSELQTLQEAFSEFGRSVLQTISNIISQWISMQIITGITKGLGSLFGGGGVSYQGTSNSTTSAIGASMGYYNYTGHQLGTPYIPSTGLYQLHKGESVVPAHESKGNKSMIQPIVVIQAWNPADVMRNMDMISTGLIQSLRSNGSLREAFQKYGR